MYVTFVPLVIGRILFEVLYRAPTSIWVQHLMGERAISSLLILYHYEI